MRSRQQATSSKQKERDQVRSGEAKSSVRARIRSRPFQGEGGKRPAKNVLAGLHDTLLIRKGGRGKRCDWGCGGKRKLL